MAKKQPEKKGQNILNLDAFCPEPKTLRFGGRDYQIIDPPLETFLKVLDMQARMEATDSRAVFEAMADLVTSVVPELTREGVYKMNSKQLMAAVQYVIHDITGVDTSKNAEGPAETETAES